MTDVRLSAVVTTFNSAATLQRCLASLAFADEILVADSGSTDATLALCAAAGARVVQIPFEGYRAKKRDAVAQAAHAWVLLLDSDEWLQPGADEAIRGWLGRAGDTHHGARLPRIERIFWRYAAAGTRHNTFLRLFRRDVMQMSSCSVHAAPTVPGAVATLPACLVHEGEATIAGKVDKINHYSTGLAKDRVQKARWVRMRMLLDPPWTFFKSYLLRRQCLNGWAGLINSASLAFYAFLRHAKVHEARQVQVLPPGTWAPRGSELNRPTEPR